MKDLIRYTYLDKLGREFHLVKRRKRCKCYGWIVLDPQDRVILPPGGEGFYINAALALKALEAHFGPVKGLPDKGGKS